MRLMWPSAGVLLFVGCLLTGCSTQSPEEHLANALEYRAAGNDDAAIIELKNALKKDADFQPARAELANQLFASGDYVTAQNEFKRALLGAAPGAAANEALLERKRLTSIRLREAADVIVDLTEQEALGPPLTPRERAILGLARLALDDMDLAREEFSTALAADSELAYANFGQAQVHWADNAFERAWPLFLKASSLAPRDPHLWLVQGEFALEQLNLDGARDAFAAARALPGQGVPARLGQARVLIFDRDLVTAKSEIDAVLGVAPDYVPALYLGGLVTYEQGDHKAAELALREVQSLQPNYTAALYLMGAVQFQLKDYAQAELNLKRYLEVQSGNVSARKLLAAVLMQREDYTGVIAALAPVVDAQNDAQLLAMLGTAYARTNRLSQASVLLERAVDLAPDVGRLRNQLAVTLLAAGESEQAVGALQSAVKLDGEMMLSDYLLVLALLREGKADEALAAAQALRDRSPDDPMGDNLVGAVRFAQGEPGAARESFNAALAKDSGFEPAALNLVRLNVEEGNRGAAVEVLNQLLESDPENERALLRLAELALTETQTETQTETPSNAEAFKKAETLLRRAASAHLDSLAPRLALARLGLMSQNLALADLQSKQALELAPEDITALSVRIESLLQGKLWSELGVPMGKLAQRVRSQQPVVPAQLLSLARLQQRGGMRDEAALTYKEAADGGGAVFQAANLALIRFDLQRGAAVAARRRLVAADDSVRSSLEWRLLAGDVARAENNLQDAERGYATLLAEGSREALFRLVALHTQTGRPELAGDLLRDWLAANPGDTSVEVALATSELSAGDFAASQQSFEDALVNDPDNVVVLNNLAYLYQQTKDGRARPTASKAWQLAPDNADVGDTYGWILYSEGEESLARDVLVKAMALAPTNPLIGYHAAKALAATGRTEQAIIALQRITQPPPGSQGRVAFSGAPEYADALALLRQLSSVDDVDGQAEAEPELVE